MLKIGITFPQTEIGNDPIKIRDFAQAVEALDYAFLLPFDHVLGANPDRPGGWSGPYSLKHSFHEPFVLFSYLAGLTKRIEFVTGVLILPQRQTVLVASRRRPSMCSAEDGYDSAWALAGTPSSTRRLG